MSWRVVHVSDLHLISDVGFRWSYLRNKRITGYANLVARRWRLHDPVLAFEAARAIRALEPDLLVVTGDLTNLALDEEFALAARWLEAVGLGPDRTVVVLGNHDAYVSDVWDPPRVCRFLGGYLPSDPEERRPQVRAFGDILVVGLETAQPMPVFMAWGRGGGDQLDRVRTTLSDPHFRVRILALHHAVPKGITRWPNVLLDAHSLRGLLAEVGAEVVLTGHLHWPYVRLLPGPDETRVAVLGVGSASMDAARLSRRAQFRVVDIDADSCAWRLFVHEPRSRRFVELPEGSGSYSLSSMGRRGSRSGS